MTEFCDLELTETKDNPSFAYENPPPSVPGWTASNLDNGFVSPSAYGSADIICHKSATPGKAYVSVKAGDSVKIQWTPLWPVGHKGPVLDYLAECPGDCTTVDKTALKFVKIAQGGLIDGSTNPGTYATDTIVKNNSTWTVAIPAALKPGNYVLRHEIIGLHVAGSSDGAQNYPQCINLKVSGSGTVAISGGVPATAFYKATDPGILFDIYRTVTSYVIPGPAVWTPKASKARRHERDFE